MAPTLTDGELVFTRPIKKGALAVEGDMVVLRAGGSFIVKRVVEVNEEYIVVTSDSESETSVFCHRPLSHDRVVGKVIGNFQ